MCMSGEPISLGPSFEQFREEKKCAQRRFKAHQESDTEDQGSPSEGECLDTTGGSNNQAKKPNSACTAFSRSLDRRVVHVVRERSRSVDPMSMCACFYLDPPPAEPVRE
ncbi:hypothetical protein C8J57DRAFT_1238455 [Mycena rebaudengoi]|nr:hypothetical protein C8J57DRAFT_1238455 [Mycena rebaudengoi]